MERIAQLKPQTKSRNGTLLCGDIRTLYAEESKQYTVIGSHVHAIYEPLKDENAIDFLKTEIPILSDDYLGFLKKHNGLNAFSDSFCLYGFGRILKDGNYILSRDPQIVLPFHIGDYNREASEFYVIGSFGECKLINFTLNNYYALLDTHGNIKTRWGNIDELIKYCIDNLMKQYDNNGKSINPLVVGKIIFNKTKNI